MRANLAALCMAAFAGAGVCYGRIGSGDARIHYAPGYFRRLLLGFCEDAKLRRISAWFPANRPATK